jgi:hypothetical protein
LYYCDQSIFEEWDMWSKLCTTSHFKDCGGFVTTGHRLFGNKVSLEWDI